MEWHLSKYTMFTKPPDYNFIIAVNLMKGTQTILFPNEVPMLMNFKNLKEEDNLLKKFKRQGLIVNYNELAMLDAMAKTNCAAKRINLTICPTLNCNFDCPYCFEKHFPGKMSNEVQDKIVSFVEKLISASSSKSLAVTWYGGEPLLAFDVIEKLSDKIINLCNSRGIYYGASIITNGYLLNQKIVDMLSDKKVASYQITIDGIEDTHNKTRRLTNGEGTFDKIIENLRLLKINGYVAIRHNVHKNNLNEVKILKKFIEILSKQSNNDINYYPAVVAGNAAEKRDGQVNFLSKEEECEIYCLRGLNFSPGRPQYCGAEYFYSFTIDDEGNLYKCWEDVGNHNRSFGTVDTWKPQNPFMSSTNIDVLTTYLNLSGVSEDKECRECIWLPLCRGGCPSKRLYFKRICLPWKDNPEIYLSKITEKSIKKWEERHNIKNNK